MPGTWPPSRHEGLRGEHDQMLDFRSDANPLLSPDLVRFRHTRGAGSLGSPWPEHGYILCYQCKTIFAMLQP
jgi:hypothetical protein